MERRYVTRDPSVEIASAAASSRATSVASAASSSLGV
jgi:hypothetical protein